MPPASAMNFGLKSIPENARRHNPAGYGGRFGAPNTSSRNRIAEAGPVAGLCFVPVLIHRKTCWTTRPVGQSMTASQIQSHRFRRNLLCYAARIAIPHPTTASAIRMQVAVKAFSKADEGIVMLSFAYPAKRLRDST